ncbi:DUF2961 domain-containing protein [Maribacter sp. 2304DJ31-5]|uniref:DUF2961 domain-containing protein n=1 Tax=Maribacter sp. 2304DJ31-5 TaxID=3386273 RepID=UPI0039BC3862
MDIKNILFIIWALLPLAIMAQGKVDIPTVPIADDAYLQWERLPYHKIGVRGYMRSTYDRRGNNYFSDAGHFLYQESDAFNVTLDVKNPGILYFKRTNFFHGSPWHYETDGEDFIVKETATDDPVDIYSKYTHTEFIPQNLFPEPLTWTWATTKGADLMWVPIPFEKSFRIAYSRTYYGTGYYIYHTYPLGADHLSKPLKRWDKTPPNPKVVNFIKKAGTDISPLGNHVKTIKKENVLAAYQKIELAHIQGSSNIRLLQFKIPIDEALEFGKNRLIVTWDQRWHASIDVPLDLFFGAGHLYNPENKEYLVKGLPMNIRYDKNYAYLSCYWPMPFEKTAKIELEERNGHNFSNFEFTLKTEPFHGFFGHVGYFHATYSDHPAPEIGEDITFLDSDQAEGGGPWSGNFVGMSWTFTDTGNLSALEGDPRFFFDDSRTPQAWGTGSEEWGGGGNYWGGENMTIPLAGHPVGKAAKAAKDSLDLINSAYRFLIADYFPFGKRAVIRLEHGGVNTAEEHYSGVVYWYGAPNATLQLTDTFNVCNSNDIKEHKYRSPSANTPYLLTSRYEWGPHTDMPDRHSPHGQEHYKESRMFFPTESDSVRIMKGNSQFEVNLDPDNLGVLLRRKFDYQYPNQEAKVWVKNADDSISDWNYTGIWYTSGSSTAYASWPKGKFYSQAELAPPKPEIIDSDRRWREEEFLIARKFTEGISKLAIKIEWVPNTKKLLKDRPFPIESAWSEARYWIYCYKLPSTK